MIILLYNNKYNIIFNFNKILSFKKNNAILRLSKGLNMLIKTDIVVNNA